MIPIASIRNIMRDVYCKTGSNLRFVHLMLGKRQLQNYYMLMSFLGNRRKGGRVLTLVS